MDPISFTDDISATIVALLGRACPAEPRPGLLVALSGGPDSVALLLAAKAWSRTHDSPLAAAHLNHGLRGIAADADADFCTDLCARLDVPLHLEHADPRPTARTRGGGLEEAGRHLRRVFLLGVLDREPDLDAVATGHHRDDQAETVLMRLLRGTGPEGLQGIRPVADRFIHPLLGTGRSAILAHLEAVGQPWRDDATNSDGDNTRARLRRELLPVARDIFGPGCLESPARLADLLADELDLLTSLTDEALAGARRGEALHVPTLADLSPPLARRALRRWIRPRGEDVAPDLERVHLEAIMGWLATGASGSALDLPGHRQLVRSFDEVRIVAAGSAPPLRSAADYRILVSNDSVSASVHHDVGDPLDESTWALTCPGRALSGNLRVRNWREGDRFQPFGLDGRKKLSDLLREKRVPAADRPGVLLVEDDAGILWIVGLARAERTRMLPTDETTVTMRVVSRR